MTKRLNKTTIITDDKLAVSDKNEYVRKLIEQLRKINKGELDEAKIDFTQISIKQSLTTSSKYSSPNFPL